MKIAEKYEELLALKKELNERLSNLNFEKIKELIIWLAKSKSYQRVKEKDNQMIILDLFCSVWLEEKKKLEPMGIHEDIFCDVKSLEDMEKKYLAIKYCALRLENNIPEIYCEQAVNKLIDLKVSGIAIGRIIITETYKRENNIICMAQWMKMKQQMITAIILLQYGEKFYERDRNILLELADCWIAGQQWQQAYVCLEKIDKPEEVELDLMKELEKVLEK